MGLPTAATTSLPLRPDSPIRTFATLRDTVPLRDYRVLRVARQIPPLRVTTPLAGSNSRPRNIQKEPRDETRSWWPSAC
jgi:hypothetical protein